MWVRRRRHRTVGRPDPEAGSWQPLAEIGLIDPVFFGAVAGVEFHDLAAAGAAVEATWGRLLPPHPLLDPAFLPEQQQDEWRRGDMAAVVRYLSSSDGLGSPWSSLFDPRLISAQCGPKQAWPRVVAFLMDLHDGVVLPTPGDISRTVTWHEARSILTKHARETRTTRRRLRAPRKAGEWDATAEAAWLAEVARSPLPDGASPLVSIVMPVWNRARMIGDAVRSVQAQTLSNWELLVVDDGSTDETVSVLRQLADKDSRIVVLEQPHAGVCASRSAGLARVRGRYVAFLDSDNTWRPHYLDTMVRAMSRDELSVAYAGVALHDGGKTVYRVFEGGLEHLLHVNHIDLNVLMLEADVAARVGGFDSGIRRWVDHDYIIRAARLVAPVFLPFLGCDYYDERSDPQRITTSESSRWQWVVLGKAWVDWEALERGLADRVPGRTSVVITTTGDAKKTRSAVASVLATTGDEVEVVVVDNGSRLAIGLALAAAFVGVERVRVVTLHRNMHAALGANIGFAHSTGEFVVFLHHDTIVRAGWLDSMRGQLSGGSVAVVPLHLSSSSATVIAQEGEGDIVDGLLAPNAATFCRADTVIRLRGFDPIYVDGLEDADLWLRAHRLFGGDIDLELMTVIEQCQVHMRGLADDVEENRAIFLERWSGGSGIESP